MTKQKGYTAIVLTIVVMLISIGTAWAWNVVKLSSCDFEPGWKCMACSLIGLH